MHQFEEYDNAKLLWEALENRFEGTESIKKNLKSVLKQQLQNFYHLKNEKMTDTFNRYNKLINDLAKVGHREDQDDINRKFLLSLPDEWTVYTVPYRQGDQLSKIELQDLYTELRTFELEMEQKKMKAHQNIASSAVFKSSVDNSIPNDAFTNTTAHPTATGTEGLTNLALEAFISVNSSVIFDDLCQVDQDDLEEMDLKWQLALLSMKVKKFITRTGRNNFALKRDDVVGFDKSKVKCYNCDKMGHFARECQSKRKENSQNSRHNNNTKNTNSSALINTDGFGFDWSEHAEETIQNHALMAIRKVSGKDSSSESNDDIPSEQKKREMVAAAFEEDDNGGSHTRLTGLTVNDMKYLFQA